MTTTLRTPAAVLALTLLSTCLFANGPDAVGGGYMANGMLGEYFSNADLSGSPQFTRRDVRIDFDWGTMLPVGGSTYSPYRTFPQDNFSVRWTGQLIPRFTEDYVIVAHADEGIRVSIKDEGAGSWVTIIDNWDGPGSFESAPQSFTAGAVYDFQVEYRDIAGAAQCRILWRSHNTPQEIIDPVAAQALNVASWDPYLWADHVKAKRWGANSDRTDADGWPTGDSVEFVLGEMSGEDLELRGTYLMRFKGRATVQRTCCSGVTFYVDGADYGQTLPAGTGYDAATNTTTAVMVASGSRMMFRFTNTSRDGQTSGTGFTDLDFIRPIAPGDTLYHDTDEITYRPMKEVVQRQYTCLRYLGGANRNSEKSWAGRTKPSHMKFVGDSGQENWEYFVMLCNETGRDMYICSPVKANDEYFTNLANLLRYGSDGDMPYTSEQAAPAYPPLNPNLRIYIEVGNEIWNWSFQSTQAAQRENVADSAANNEQWQIVNYDGNAGNASWAKALRRWHGIRTVICSQALRSAYGDEGFGTRFRPLIEYQYDNAQATASHSFEFLNNWYNNADGDHVAEPHPVSYHIWGGGGATYYGVGNNFGTQSAFTVPDSGFENANVGANTLTANPGGSAWTFTGEAGVYNGSGSLGTLTGLDPATEGTKAAYIVDEGELSVDINFTQTGNFAIKFNAGGEGGYWPGYNPFNMYMDTMKISPKEQTDIRISSGSFSLGGWNRPTDNMTSEWGSAVFNIATTGTHTLRIVGESTQGRWISFDNFQVCSVDSLVLSGFGSGQAIGQPADDGFLDRCNNQSIYCRTFGLPLIAYEAGWSVGGDFTQLPIQNWTKLMDSRCTATNDRAEQIWDESGSFMNVWGVYTYWPSYDFDNSASYPHMQSFTGIANRLRDEPNHGVSVPGTLYPDDKAWNDGGVSNTDLAALGDWASWLFVAPDIAQYDVEVAATAGGSMRVFVDGTQIGTLASSEMGLGAPMSIVLTRGAHAVRVENTSGTQFTIDSIVISSTPVSVRPRTVMVKPPTPEIAVTTNGWSAAAEPAAVKTAPQQPTVPNSHAAQSTAQPVKTATVVAAPAVPFAPKEEKGFDQPPLAVRGDDLEPRSIPVPDYIPTDMHWTGPTGALTVAGVSASSTTGSHAAGYVLDRDLRSRWSPADAQSTLTCDLGSPHDVQGATVVWYALRSSRTSCRVETSIDGRTFTCVWDGTLKGRGTNTEDVSFVTHAARYLRISLDSRDGRGVSLYEIAVRGDGGLAAR